MQKYYIKTYGCQMNIADSEKLAAVLKEAGYIPVEDELAADIILVNTCVVRQNAEDRAAWFVTSMKNYKEQRPSLKIGLCGCIVNEPGRNIKKEFPHVDWFIPPNSPDTLKQYLAKNTKSEIRNTKQIQNSNFEIVSPCLPAGRNFGFRASSFVTIMHGCNNFCSYCIVPYVRGKEISRPMEDVLAEVKALIDQGVTDITLLGQNVNSYEPGLAKLLKGIEGIRKEEKGLEGKGLKVRFLTSHPRDLSDEIIETVAELPFVEKEFQLPIQSGDDTILEKMNRGYTLDYYLGRVNKIRALIPEARIMTDIIVGFPGETDEQFQNTLKAVDKIKFREIHMFAYSNRAGTAAAKMGDQVPDDSKQARLKKLIEINRKILAK
ncbi:MAG: tRNA (N6-isopentenyl adenosine(37)-C2)-methylthiotransferase MiaB [Candidatus Margulisiibacteriota bacterium]